MEVDGAFLYHLFEQKDRGRQSLFFIEIFLFYYINGIEHLSHDVQHSALWYDFLPFRSILQTVESSNRDADHNVDQTQESQGED